MLRAWHDGAKAHFLNIEVITKCHGGRNNLN